MQENPSDESEAPIIAPKAISGSQRAAMTEKPVKRQLTDKQKEILAKGREKAKESLKLKREQSQKVKQEMMEQLAIKKANNLIKKKVGLKKDFNLEDADDEEEDILIPVQPKKPKKKQIVYLPPESESEEEIIYKRAPPARKPIKQHFPEPEPQPAPVNKHRVVFY